MFNKVFSFLFKDSREHNKSDANTPFYMLSKEEKNKHLKAFFSDIPTLETERLILCRIKPSDYKDIYEYSADPEVTKFLTWHPHKTVAETSEYIQYVQKRYASGKFYDWGIKLKENQKMIGTCGFTTINLDSNCGEIGYVLNHDYWGRGLVPEACEMVIKYGFCYFGFDYIYARFIDGNVNSMKVMMKCGMKYFFTDRNTMRIKGEYKTIHHYKITKEEYFQRLK